MNKFGNSLKDKKLKNFPNACIESTSDLLTTKCKFNFDYFTKQPSSQDFNEWTLNDLISLLESIKHFCAFPLEHWQHEIRGNHPTLSIYGDFPSNDKTDFTLPTHVPHQALWARFRLASKLRLIGFVIPQKYKNQVHSKTKIFFDTNTFYVVFLDKDHKFYKTGSK